MTYDCIVIGAGQAGLSAGYHLAQRGQSFLILEAAEQAGGSWQNRWDSVHVFTPNIRNGLPGMEFPGGYGFASAEEMVGYLRSYAARFELPVRTGTKVDGLFREGDRWRVTAGAEAFDTRTVVLATGMHRVPRLPAFAAELTEGIVSFHSASYRNPGQLQPGPVLIVGAGNTGADLAVELAATHDVLLAGRNVGQLPIEIRGWQGRALFPLLWWVWEHLLTERTPMGRKARAKVRKGHSEPLIRLKEKDLRSAGVRRLPRIAGIVNGLPQTEDGEVLEIANLIWATGFRPGFEWLDLPGLDASAHLPTQRGSVDGQPGLYVLGQEFQYMFNSHTIGGVGKDAAHVADLVAVGSSESVPAAV